MVKRIKPEFEFADERGKLLQLCSNGWKQINVSYSKKNVARGSHYHKKNREMFYIIKGVCVLGLTDTKSGNSEEVTLHEGDMVIVEPYAKHTFRYEEDTIMLAAYDIGFLLPDGTKDVFE